MMNVIDKMNKFPYRIASSEKSRRNYFWLNADEYRDEEKYRKEHFLPPLERIEITELTDMVARDLSECIKGDEDDLNYTTAVLYFVAMVIIGLVALFLSVYLYKIMIILTGLL